MSAASASAMTPTQKRHEVTSDKPRSTNRAGILMPGRAGPAPNCSRCLLHFRLATLEPAEVAVFVGPVRGRFKPATD